MTRASILYRHKVVNRIARENAKKYLKKYNPMLREFEKLVKEYIKLYGYNPDYTSWVKPLLDFAFLKIDEEKIKDYMYRQNKVKYFAEGFIKKITKEVNKKNKKKS